MITTNFFQKRACLIKRKANSMRPHPLAQPSVELKREVVAEAQLDELVVLIVTIGLCLARASGVWDTIGNKRVIND